MAVGLGLPRWNEEDRRIGEVAYLVVPREDPLKVEDQVQNQAVARLPLEDRREGEAGEGLVSPRWKEAGELEAAYRADPREDHQEDTVATRTVAAVEVPRVQTRMGASLLPQVVVPMRME